MTIDAQTQIELEAAAFRTLQAHLQTRTDVQNIDMMNLAGFCRNCLSRWYQEAAAEKGITISKDDAREMFYGMPFQQWKEQHQTEASAESISEFKKIHEWDNNRQQDSIISAHITTMMCTLDWRTPSGVMFLALYPHATYELIIIIFSNLLDAIMFLLLSLLPLLFIGSFADDSDGDDDAISDNDNVLHISTQNLISRFS